MSELDRPRGGRFFRALIRHQGKDYPLGLFISVWDAALAYNMASEAIGRGAKPPNEIPLSHRPTPETVRLINAKVRARLGLPKPPIRNDSYPPSDAELTTFLEITVIGFWRDQASRDGEQGHSKGLDVAARRILLGAELLFWNRGQSFREEVMAEILVRRLNGALGRSDLPRAILDDDRDDSSQLAWWLALPDHLASRRGFREEVEYRYPELFQGTEAPSQGWAEILGVAPPFSIEKVRRAYRSKSRHAHPDAGGTENAFVRLSAAYQEALDYLGHSRRSRPT